MTDEEAKLISTLAWSVRDALALARTHASRASEHLSQRPGCIEFWDLASAIAELDNHPAMQAVKVASIPPSMLGPKAGGST